VPGFVAAGLACVQIVGLAAALAGWPDDAEPAALIHCCPVPMLWKPGSLWVAEGLAAELGGGLAHGGTHQGPMAGRQMGLQA